MNPVRQITLNGAFALALDGHIDSGNAAETEKAIASLLSERPSGALTLDAAQLSYISSAGLRVLLRLMKAGWKLTMLNASPAVYGIMETTGFSEMMTVRKAYRSLSVDDCEIIGKGANGTVYRLDAETIVKVYRDADAFSDLNREREIARRAFILGIPTAISYDIVRVGDSYGAVFELLNATTVSKLVAGNPQGMDTYAALFTDLLKHIHQISAKPGDLPDMKEIALQWAQTTGEYLEKKAFEHLLRLIREAPEDLHLIHGDFHSNNVLVQNGEALLIDLDTLCCGHPVFELASVFNAFVGFGEPDPGVVEGFLKMPYSLATQFFRKVLELYFGTREEETLAKNLEKIQAVGYMRLLHRALRRNIESDKAKRRIAHYTSRLSALMERVDTLLF